MVSMLRRLFQQKGWNAAAAPAGNTGSNCDGRHRLRDHLPLPGLAAGERGEPEIRGAHMIGKRMGRSPKYTRVHDVP
jgi:hypothetical protein